MKFLKFSESKYYYYFISIFIISVHQLIYQPFIGPTSTNYGDFAMFMEHWLVGKIWFNKNFLQVPWFTPTHCMSFPFYANPQNLYYSISQILFILFDPKAALKLYFLLLSVLSYVGSFLLLNKTFKFNYVVSIIGATLFLLNGFFNERFIVAHYGVVTYALVPFYLYFLYESTKYSFKDKNFYFNISLSSVFLAQIVYGGAAALLLHIFYAILLSAIILMVLQKHKKKLFINLTISFILFFLLSISKISSAFFLLEVYPRDFLEPIVTNDFFLLLKIIFLNLFVSTGNEGAFVFHNGDNIFSHELNYFVTIVPLVVIFLFFLQNLNKFRINNLKLNATNALLILFIFLLLLFPILISHKNGLVDLFSNMPVIKNLWINSRFLLVYQLPIIFLTCFCVQKLQIKNMQMFFVALIFVGLFHAYIYPKSHHQRFAFYVNDQEMLDQISSEDYAINNVLFAIEENDHKTKFKNGKFVPDTKDFIHIELNRQLKNNGTLFDCYEPVLGYEHEQRESNIKIILPAGLDIAAIKGVKMVKTSPFWKVGNQFNFNNPICQLFPDENDCKKGDAFRLDQETQLKALLNFKPVKFKKSGLQNLFDILSFVFAIVLFILIVVVWILKIYKKISNDIHTSKI